MFEGHEIAAGAEKPLAVTAHGSAASSSGTADHEYTVPGPGGATPKESFVRQGLIFDPNQLATLDRWNTDKDPSHLLIPGTYIAFLKKSPFVEARLDAARSEDTVAIVCGICSDFPSVPGISAKSAGPDHGR